MGKSGKVVLVFFQWIRKLLIVSFLLFLFFFTTLIFGIQIPYVQTRLVDFTTQKLSEVVNYPIKIGGIKITFTGGLVLENVMIQDSRRLDMLTVKEIIASFKLVSLFGKDIVLQKVTLNQANVKLRYYPEVDDVNLSDFISSLQHIGEDSLDKLKPDVPHVGRYTNFIVKVVDLQNAKFSFEDVTKVHSKDKFEFSKFSLDSIYISVSKFKIVRDTVSFNVKNLRCKDEKTGLKIHHLDSDFGICENYMKLQQLDADIGSSHISDAVVFNYNGYSQLSDIEDSVWLDLNIKNAQLDTKDVAIFFPDLKHLKDKWLVSGKMKGFFYDFRVNDFDLQFGSRSSARGNAGFKGLPNIYQTVMDIELVESTILPEDLKQYGLNESIEEIKPFGKSNVNGEFLGKYHDFHFEGEAQTQLGGITGDFQLQFDEKDIVKSAVYHGVLGLQDFNSKPFGSPDWLKNISFNLKIDGKGFEPKDATVNASGFVTQVDLANYNFKNTFLSLRYSHKKGQASLDVQDSNLVMDVILKTDFNEQHEKLELDAHIFKADIYKMGFYSSPLNIASEINFNSKGFNPESFNFDLLANNTAISSNSAASKIPSFKASYQQPQKEVHTLDINSNAANLNIKGKFELFSLASVLDSLILHVDKSFEGWNYTNLGGNLGQNESVDAAFEINIKKINPLLAIFAPDIKLSQFSSFKGQLNTKKGIELGFKANMDSITWKNILFTQNKIDLNIEKTDEAKPINASFLATSFSQFVDDEPATENLSIDAHWQNNIIAFKASTKQQNESNDIKLAGELKVGSIEKTLTLQQVELNILNNNWHIDEGNAIIFRPQFIGFNKFDIQSDSQLVSLQGELSKDSEKKLNLVMKNFRIQNLEKVFNKKLDGTVEGYLTIQDFYTQPKINSVVKANDLKVNKLYIGNIAGKSHWDNINKKIDLNLDVERFGNKMFSLHGNYTPNLEKKEERLNIVAILNKTNLVIFEPFIKDVLSDIKGDATGLITLRGNLNNPIINGEIDIDGGAVKVNYLNTTYYFDEKISMNPTGFVMNNIVLDDHKGGLAVLEGGIYHTNFKDFKIRIEGEFKNIQLLNTAAKDNEIYYGEAIGTGNFSLKGDFNAIAINLKAQAQKGTKVSIVYNSASNTEGQSFIKFVSSKNRQQTQLTNKKNQQSKNDNFKVTANLDIDITTDAYAEFILSKNTGDKIAGYGKGKISLYFDNDEDFAIYGDYTFERDSYYLFTFLNLINKKFAIQKGSNVQWNGDPAAGKLDVTARYEDRIPLYPLVDSAYWNRSGIRTPYPVATILYVKGEILQPEISYDIKIYNYPAAISDVPLFSYISAFENKIKNNVNEMNTQVFSLLVFRRFLYGTSGLEGAAGSTVSELLTNQLSQIVSQLDKNLQVDLRMNGLDRAALNTVQVRVSYELLDGKVRITRSGSVTNSQSQATTSSIIGDISVEYILTNDGRFRLKGFTRQNPNSLSISAGSQGNSSTGVSILHTTSFNSLNPFDRKKKKKKADPKETTKGATK